jgi:hypothetical protein
MEVLDWLLLLWLEKPAKYAGNEHDVISVGLFDSGAQQA